MSEEMQTEIEKRIEVELESIWNGERKEVEYKFKNFDTGFRVGAKFILMLPELREIREVLAWYATKGEGPYTDAGLWRRAKSALETLKVLGIVKEGEK